MYALSLDIVWIIVDVKINIVCTISKYGYGLKSTSITFLIGWTLQIINMIYV